jgi:hypothetical protein
MSGGGGPGRVGKKPGFKKKPAQWFFLGFLSFLFFGVFLGCLGFLGFFWVVEFFWVFYIFAQKREFLWFF